MKTIQGNLIHSAQAGEFDLIVHGCNCFCTMGAGGGGRGNIEHRTPNIEHRREENLELPEIGAGIGEGINAATIKSRLIVQLERKEIP